MILGINIVHLLQKEPAEVHNVPEEAGTGKLHFTDAQKAWSDLSRDRTAHKHLDDKERTEAPEKHQNVKVNNQNTRLAWGLMS